MSKTIWDLVPETTEVLKQLIADGQSAGAVSVELSRLFSNRCGEITRNMVIGKAHRLGLKLNLDNRKNCNQARYPGRAVSAPSAARAPIAATPRIDAPPIAPVEGLRIGVLLVDLEHRACKWPINEAEGAYIFCGRRGPDGASYCRGHMRMAYRP